MDKSNSNSTFTLAAFLAYYFDQTPPIEEDVASVELVAKHVTAYELFSDDEKSLYISVVKFRIEKMRHDPTDARKELFLDEYDKIFKFVVQYNKEEAPYRQREMSEKLLLTYYLFKCSILDTKEGENRINFSFINN